MDDGVPAYEAMGSAYSHGALSGKSLLCATALGFKQALHRTFEYVVAAGDTNPSNGV